MSELEQNLKKNLTIDSNLNKKFETYGFNKLTEIQKKASPYIFSKKDCIITAPTGSGKTECSVIPIFSHLNLNKQKGKIKALYITPLRSLNRDVFRRITHYAHQENLTIEIRHGDTPQSIRKKITNSPPDVLITTPETLVILLTQQKMLMALSELEWLIVDEIHELLASKRGTQLSLSLEKLQYNSNKKIIRIGLSATVGNIDDASHFLVGTGKACKIIEDKSIRKYDVEIKYIDGNASAVADSIIEYVKKLKLQTPILLFTNTRGEAEFLASILKEKTKMNVELHHGSLSRQVRENTESILRSGSSGIVVCTSSLELGLDIGSVELVIHFGSPRQVSKLMQRIGRSKHSNNSSASGLIVTNVPDDEFEAHAILDRVKNSSIEEQKLHENSFDVLAHHLVGLTMQLGEVNVSLAYKIMAQAYPFRNLKLDDLSDVLQILHDEGILFFDKSKMLFRKRQLYPYFFKNLSTIPEILRYKVKPVGEKNIGTLDQKFVRNKETGNIFVLRGKQWRIIDIDNKKKIVNVESVKQHAKVPYWEGETIPVDFVTAQTVGKLRTKTKDGSLSLQNKIISELNITVPNHKTVVIESMSREIIIHSCFGTKINSTLATLLSSFLEARLGSVIKNYSDAYRIVLSSETKILEDDFIEALKINNDIQQSVKIALTDTHNIHWPTWFVAKKFGAREHDQIYDPKSAYFTYKEYKDTPIVKEALRELFHDKHDLEGTKSILTQIKNKKISIKWYNVTKFSKLAEPLLDHTARYYASPASFDTAILEEVKKRILDTKHRLICARCGKWERIISTKDYDSRYHSCPYCKATQITRTYYSDDKLSEIIRNRKLSQIKFEKLKKQKSELKAKLGKVGPTNKIKNNYRDSINEINENMRLLLEEKKDDSKAWKIGNLISTHKSMALIALSGYGVGADTGARLLRNMISEENLYKQIYEAERQYTITRGFWDS